MRRHGAADVRPGDRIKVGESDWVTVVTVRPYWPGRPCNGVELVVSGGQKMSVGPSTLVWTDRSHIETR